MEISRRSFVGVAGAAAAAAAACTGLNLQNAMAATEESAIFEGTARGMRGHVTVHVTLADDAIAKIDVVENTETPEPVSRAAVKVVPQAIVDAQTVNVDTVTGATISSMAIVSAVTRALEAAGVADRFQGDAPAPASAPEDCSCDVLVVGGGLAGTNAAVAARYTDYGKELDDLDVILVEAQGFIGGSSCLAGGIFGATQPLNDSAANVERLMPDALAGLTSPDWPVDEQLIANIATVSGTNVYQNILLGMSVDALSGIGKPEDFDDIQGWYHAPMANPTVFKEGVWSFVGWTLTDHMEDMLERTGVDVRLNSRAAELVVEDGTVTGVVVETPGGSYAISAKKVILATGGFGQNPDYISEYCPTYEGALKYMNAGCKGDGITMAKAVDAVVDGFDNGGGPLGVDVFYGAFNDMGYDFFQGVNFPAGYSCVVVNNEGKRFMTDSAALVADEDELPKQVMRQPGGSAWSIFGADNPVAEVVDASAMQDSIFRADTITELAELIDVPVDALAETIEKYNETATSGKDDEEFGVPNDAMFPVTSAPFYAVKCLPTMCYTTVGLRLGSNCEVVNNAGEVVPNLYACGELAYQGTAYTCLGGAMAAGRLAGDSAREALA